MTTAGRDEVLAALATQVRWCHLLAAPFTAGLVALVRDDVAAGGPLAALLVPWPGNPLADALPIRIAGAFHALVRAGRVPELATLYPPGPPPVWDDPAVAATLAEATRAHRDVIAAFIAHPPQTNEVGRSAILMAGYAAIAAATGGLPLRVLELGASAGLNLVWDRYAYRLGDVTIRAAGAARAPRPADAARALTPVDTTRALAAPDAALTLAPEWRGAPPPIAHLPTVAMRRGCDRSPIDLGAPGAAERLLAYVWPDHPERVARLAAAIRLVRAAPPPIDAADAGAWLERELATPVPGVATVVAHTIVWQYFAPDTAERARRAIEAAGAAATAEGPLAWLSFEQRTSEAPPELRLTVWPGGARRVLARAHPHGGWVEWLTDERG